MSFVSKKSFCSYPGLDRYDEETAERLVETALYQRREAGRALLLSVVIFTLLIWGFVLSRLVYDLAIMVLENNIFPRSDPDTISTISMLIAGVGFVWFPLLITVPIWELWTRRCLRKLLISVQCLGCGYSLMGLQIQYDYDFLYVECPECNRKRIIQDTGLKAADIDPAGKYRPS